MPYQANPCNEKTEVFGEGLAKTRKQLSINNPSVQIARNKLLFYSICSRVLQEAPDKKFKPFQGMDIGKPH